MRSRVGREPSNENSCVLNEVRPAVSCAMKMPFIQNAPKVDFATLLIVAMVFKLGYRCPGFQEFTFVAKIRMR